jgi:protein-disulfide isomerase
LKKYIFIMFGLLFLYSTVSPCLAEEKGQEWLTEFKKENVDISGLNEKSLDMVINVLNKTRLASRCNKILVGNCVNQDPNCCYSRYILKELVFQARYGKSEDHLQGLLDGYFFANKEKELIAWDESHRVYPVVPGESPWKGAKDALITIVEFTDFQCPYCLRGDSTMDQILEAYPTQVRLYVKNNPLPFHKNAFRAAQAALAANRQGKYWEMHKLLFNNSKTLSEENIQSFAKQIGLNMEQFKKDIEDPQIKKQIEADKVQAKEVTATGTPTFFINGRKIRGAQKLEAFKAVINEELAKSNKPKAQK